MGFQVCKEQLLSRSFTQANRDMGSCLPVGTHTVAGGRRAMGHRQDQLWLSVINEAIRRGLSSYFGMLIFYLIHR